MTYTTGEGARALYLTLRGAGTALRGKDPATSKWDRKLNELDAKAREREEIAAAARARLEQEERDAKVKAQADRLRRR